MVNPEHAHAQATFFRRLCNTWLLQVQSYGANISVLVTLSSSHLTLSVRPIVLEIDINRSRTLLRGQNTSQLYAKPYFNGMSIIRTSSSHNNGHASQPLNPHRGQPRLILDSAEHLRGLSPSGKWRIRDLISHFTGSYRVVIPVRRPDSPVFICVV